VSGWSENGERRSVDVQQYGLFAKSQGEGRPVQTKGKLSAIPTQKLVGWGGRLLLTNEKKWGAAHKTLCRGVEKK